MKNRILSLLIIFFTLLPAGILFADGSKDWYPAGANGYRGAIVSSTVSPNEYYPFPNRGVHYVYAKEGETITLATSAQNQGSNTAERIFLYSPDNVQITLDLENKGNIPNRTAELAGPSASFVSDSDSYEPVTYTVPEGGDGIYRVHLHAPNSTSSHTQTRFADENWSQPTNQFAILAWDISVINTDNTAFIPGRVYTTVLNLSNGNSNSGSYMAQDNGFYGVVYVMTKDGYTYKVDNNGNNGIWFTFFVNNNGFVDAGTQLPTYLSVNTTQNLGNRVHNPNLDDVGTHITHKMFYTMPSSDLPTSAPVSIRTGNNWNATGTTWLKNAPVVPDVSTPVFTGVDGTPGQVSNKGGYVSFNADVQGNFKIEISSAVTPAAFVTRVLTGQAAEGPNKIFWDGKDGNGNSLPIGTFPAKVTVQLQGAEVHFPFLDMEYNKNGFILELLDGPHGPTDPNRFNVYWDDTDIPLGTSPSSGAEEFRRRSEPLNNSHLPPVNSTGIDSRVNGHIWGIDATGTSARQFGDNRSIDTWTFIAGEKKESETSVTVKISDLYVSSVVADKTKIRIGDEITYTVTAGNMAGDFTDAEGAPFIFKLPVGFEGNPTDITFTSTCGIESEAISYDPVTNTFNSKLDLPVGCEVTYTFKATVTPDVTADTKASAAIMRPDDVFDPDATNTSNPINPLAGPTDPVDLDAYYYPPVDPFFEVEHNGLNGNSNNLKDRELTFGIEALNDINQTPMDTSVDGNVLTNDDPLLTTLSDAKFNGETLVVDGLTPNVLEKDGVTYGTIILHPNGSYTFEPTPGFTGTVPPISYEASGQQGDASADLTIVVIPENKMKENNKPVAQDDHATTYKDTPVTIKPLANDSDPDGNNNDLEITEIDGIPVAPGASIPVSGTDEDGNPVTDAGTLVVNPDGSLTFNPAPGFTGKVNPIPYTITDDKGDTAEAEIIIDVTSNEDGYNNTYANDDANSGPKDEQMNGNVLDNDTDPENNPQVVTGLTLLDGTSFDVGVEFTIPAGYPGEGGKLKVNADGTYTYKPAAGFVGTLVFEYEVCDNGTPSACDLATVYLTTVEVVTILAVDDFFETENNTPVDGNVIVNDYSDKDYTVSSVIDEADGTSKPVDEDGTTITTAEGGTAVIYPDGSFTYTPPTDKNAITDSFKYTICDVSTPPVCSEAEVLIAVGYCYDEVDSQDFEWSHPVGAFPHGDVLEFPVTLPATDLGYVFDIYELDNSFNMIINGVQLAVDEIDFEYHNVYDESIDPANIMFADGKTYAKWGANCIYEQRGDVDNPMVRVMISPTGSVTMYGIYLNNNKKLELLKFIESEGNEFNIIPLNESGNNTLVVTQKVWGKTVMKGRVFGRRITDCPNYWYGGVDDKENDWNEPHNWTNKYVPKDGDDVEFATKTNNNGKPAVDDLHVPTDKEYNINNLTNETGKSPDEPAQALVVPPTAIIIVDGKITGYDTPEDANKLIIDADETKPNGSFIATDMCEDTNLAVYGTVVLYAQGQEVNEVPWNDVIDGSPTSGKPLQSSHSWQHFGVPAEGVVAVNAFEKSWIQEYSESQNGNIEGSGLTGTAVTFYDKWNFVKPYDVLDMFKGYEITQKSPTFYRVEGKLYFCDKELTLTREAAAVAGAAGNTNEHYGLGQNVFGNSYTAAINLNHGIEFNSPEIEQTVYLYRTGSFQAWGNDGTVVTDGTTPNAGSYISIPAKVSTVVWDNQIPSMQGFLLKYTPGATIHNDPARTVTLKYANNGVVGNTKPQLTQQVPKSYLTATLQSKSTVDKVWLFSQEGTSDKFDNGWDGFKYFGTPTAFIYSESPEGPMQVNTSSDLDGKVLTIQPNGDTHYTLTLSQSNLSDYSDLHLVDLVSRKVVPLTGEETVYNFTADHQGKRVKRFMIVNSSDVDFSTIGLLDGYLQNNNELVMTNLTSKAGKAYLYDMAGKLITSSVMETGVNRTSVKLTSGVYILNLEAAGQRESVKLIVK